MRMLFWEKKEDINPRIAHYKLKHLDFVYNTKKGVNFFSIDIFRLKWQSLLQMHQT